jgi:diaminopimelate epimerase
MSIPTEFFKMSAGGNDFILFDNRGAAFAGGRFPDLVRRLCARSMSVGADGVILMEASQRADVRARFFNPDGGPTFCGNGGRCAARLAYLCGMAPGRMVVETDRGFHRAEVRGEAVSFEMPEPHGFEADVTIEAAGRRWSGILVDTGVPHFVVLLSEPLDGPIDAIGRALRAHPRFGEEGANVDFVHTTPAGAHTVRTFERGVEAETLACATGGVAGALALAAAGRARSPVPLTTRSGATLLVRFEGDPRRASGVRVEGEARLVFVGHLSEEALRDAGFGS